MKQFFKDIIFIIVISFVVLIVAYTCGISAAKANTIKIAVIDTGFNNKYEDKVKLCNTGHRDFTGTGLHDNHGHGTHISGLIAENAINNYCIMILKSYDPVDGGSIANSTLAIEWAILQGADIINYSGGGLSANSREKKAVLKALDAGIIIVAAAGNEHANLSHTAYYPASYDKRIVVVGNLTKDGRRAPSSSFGGPTDLMVRGTNIRGINGTMTGTSQSTAIVTGRIAKQLYTRKVLLHNLEIFGPITTDNYFFEYYQYVAQ